MPADYYRQLGYPEGHRQVKESVEQGGYASFKVLVDQMERAVKTCDEDEIDEVYAHIGVAAELFPDPTRFSPSWQHIWKDLSDRLRWKRFAYESVAAADRDGEWQIVMDNPFTNQEVVCYPGLRFDEAAYLFGYFKPSLEKNEYLRMQKVITSVMVTGE